MNNMKCYRVTLPLRQKTLHLFSRKLSNIKGKEIYVPTNYGHIAGKVWGPEDGRNVLALHGWEDNCASFDTLIPLLPKHLRVVAVDFPGHGLSSHKPLGTMYTFTDLLIDIKTIANYLQWKQFSFLGHSMGGGLSMMYASCFPQEVKAVATLDCGDSDYFSLPKYPVGTAEVIKRILEFHYKLNNPVPTYSYEDAKKRLLEGRKTFMTEEGVSHLIKRAIRPAGKDQNKFVFTRDIRVQNMDLQLFSPSIWLQYLANLQCDLLRVRAIDGIKYHRTDTTDFLENHYKDRKEQYRVISVKGLHHVHLEHPERVSPHISQFFT